FGPLLEDKLCLIFKLAPSVCRMTFPILASLLVRLVVLLPFQLLRLSLATPLPTVNTTGYIDHAAFLGTINPDTNKIPKHLFQGYLNIYNNYFKAPWMPDRTEANPNELNQDDARYGFRCCHLKNIWTAPLPPETELSRQMTTSTTSIDIMGLQAAYANLHTDQERDYFMQRYHDVISSFGGKTSYDADNRPLLVMRSNLWASGYDVDGTDQTSLGQFSG